MRPSNSGRRRRLTGLGGRVEIWTHDAGAADGFEGLDLDEFDFAPTVVLRFEGGRLMDVSSDFLIALYPTNRDRASPAWLRGRERLQE